MTRAMKIQRGWLAAGGLEPGVAKTTVGVNDSLGFTEIRKAVILMVTIYYMERIQLKSANGWRGRLGGLVG